MTDQAITTLTLAASGNWTDTDPEPIVLDTTPTISIDTHRSYFLNRIDELANDCKQGTPWVFINAAVLLEYLTNLVIDPLKPHPNDDSKKVSKTDAERYIEFINGDWLPDSYKEFSYGEEHDGVDGKTKKDLPLQMYCVLRSAMVHSFSMTPESSLWSSEKRENSTSLMKYARQGSIVICHESSGNTHLSNYPKQDAACFVAENFVSDIRYAIEKIFEVAGSNAEVKERIRRVMEARPPLSIVTLD